MESIHPHSLFFFLLPELHWRDWCDITPSIVLLFSFPLYLLCECPSCNKNARLQPRMLMTVDENLKPLSVPVRVGQAVDVVGQAGRPKTITGFQTHSTPVLLSTGDRAELATEKFVILKENPEYKEEQ
ncbi:26S proteasome non-ATPase regulatory subunit 2 homolog A-like [Henckelia pumila]|uniref:26S proteasome non-ATPase regulatory subunit 2 homolog A-like n=1 Tax=Henckelia pumila TaxID=405737 RepID=UPI003C6E8547